jgi:hypothetical protein
MQVTREPLRAWVSGRWRRRARVTESASALTAERVYEQLIREGRTTAPVGFGGRISWTIPSGPMWEIAFERTRNQVWALGRLFLLCPRCQRRATRLYVPSVVARPECRRLGTDLLDSNEDELQAQAGGVVIRRVGDFDV